MCLERGRFESSSTWGSKMTCLRGGLAWEDMGLRGNYNRKDWLQCQITNIFGYNFGILVIYGCQKILYERLVLGGSC